MSDARLSIALTDILVPEDRLRPTDEGAALALSRLIQQEGQKSPIAVYRSNAGDRPYTLIYGARRLRALEILGNVEIEAVLRTKAEARMLEITDNLVMPALDALEQAEYVTAYRHWWETEYGPVERGGNRKSNGHDDRLIRDLNSSEKPMFYNDLEDKFGISERTARRLLSIGRLHPALRNAVRGTQYATEHKYLKKLTKFAPSHQAGIAAAFRLHPDLEEVLRFDDPVTGRKGVGRMETGDWREKQFAEAWENMPRDRRAAALAKLGLMERPLNPWPSHIPPVRAMLPAPDASPIMGMLRDPYRTLSVVPTLEEIEKAKVDQAEDERIESYLKWRTAADKINEVEKERREKHDARVAKAKAAKSRKPKRGRPPDTPEVKRDKLFEKVFIPELAALLIEKDVAANDVIVRYLRKCDHQDQLAVAYHIGNGHDYSLGDIAWRVERSRSDREVEG